MQLVKISIGTRKDRSYGGYNERRKIEFGIGAGWYEDECKAYGIPFPDVKTRIEQLAESIEIIKRIWTSEKASFQGKHYSVKQICALYEERLLSAR